MIARIIGTFLSVVVACAAAAPAVAGPQEIFSGIPSVKISEAGIDRAVQPVPHEDALNLACVIQQIGGKYYWVTRENKELTRHAAGAFITFAAVDGTGYVRVIDPTSKAAASAMSATEASFDYVEHLLIGLRSVTYYGKAK